MITSPSPVRVPSPAAQPTLPSVPNATRREVAARISVVAGPIAASVVFYAVFIARSAIHFGGRMYFVLFDDAMISMRYGENLAHGHGLVYNAGAPAVEGYTNFLWTLYMALVHLLPVSDARTSLVIELTGVVVLIGCGLVAAALVRLLVPGSRLAVLLAVSATVFFYPLVFWTLRGMETGLATLLITALVLQTLHLQQAFSTRRLIAVAVLAALAVLVRDDLLLPASVVVLYAIASVGRERRPRTALVLLGGLWGTVAGHEAFRLAYYGNALPNTYYLKLQGASLPTRVTRGAYAIGSTYALTLFAPLALAGAALANIWRRADRRLVLLAAVVLTTFIYDLYIGGDAWEELRFADRFLTTSAPLLFVLGAVGVHRLTRHSSAAAIKRPAGVGLSVLALGCVLSFLSPGKVVYWLSDGGWSGGPGAIVSRMELPLIAAAVLVAVLALVRILNTRRPVLVPAAALLAGVALLVVLPNVRPYEAWRTSNAQDVAGVEISAQLGLALRSVTRPGDSIALAAVGAFPYFSQRATVDLLGVSDSHIAHEPPKTGRFHPGHTKWDYPYSIGSLRPTIVYSLYSDPGGIGAQTLRSDGYVPALIKWGPTETALDHLPGGLGVYVSPAMAMRITRQHAQHSGSPGAPVTLDLFQSSGAG